MSFGVIVRQSASGYAALNVRGMVMPPLRGFHLNSNAFNPEADFSTMLTSCCCTVRQKKSSVSGSWTRRHFARSATR